jgi:low affinity Fe/Cu permease
MKRIGYLVMAMAGIFLAVGLLLAFVPARDSSWDVAFWLLVTVWPICMIFLIGVIVWQVRQLRKMRAKLDRHTRR